MLTSKVEHKPCKFIFQVGIQCCKWTVHVGNQTPKLALEVGWILWKLMLKVCVNVNTVNFKLWKLDSNFETYLFKVVTDPDYGNTSKMLSSLIKWVWIDINPIQINRTTHKKQTRSQQHQQIVPTFCTLPECPKCYQMRPFCFCLPTLGRGSEFSNIFSIGSLLAPHAVCSFVPCEHRIPRIPAPESWRSGSFEWLVAGVLKWRC